MFGDRIIAVGLMLIQSTAAGAQEPAARPATPAATPVANVLPGTQRSAFGDIQGRVSDSKNAALPKRIVRLRDVRSGKVIESKMTDDAGAFGFRGVDPGNYVVELVDNNNRVLAASQMAVVNPSQTTTVVVKLSDEVRSFGNLLTHNLAAAAMVAGSAAAAGVLAVNVKDCVSPPCKN
ncbi:MAG TPA: carboxypeptidase-like regulatory domain-containing protein [Vicinamibacterales bacterium]|jgi:hypothetical protein|nr:carboxypeptidase-like regulatory domain-containing protein [Vicinamibacterales bacterium]